MVAIETATVMKISIATLVYIFKLFKGAKFDYDQMMEGNVIMIRNWNLSKFLFLTTLDICIFT